ncbi:MAG: sensor histidine kinase N-terminal domain-containing protein [Cyanobacteria bacterium SZAS TMP-1]|nr:sensor histidine kinase N-terminal domain-containing protein [Cyanobacteria bacterium SZAS TMP-1]
MPAVAEDSADKPSASGGERVRTRPKTLSLRRQLMQWLMIPILVLWLVGALVTYALAIAFATEGYDQALVDNVHSIASHIVASDGKVVVDLPPIALEILKDNVKDKLYYQVKDEHGKVIASDTRIPESEFGVVEDLSEKEPEYSYGRIRGEEVRIASLLFREPRSGARVVIQVAETLRAREEFADKILIGVVGPQLLIVMGIGLAIFLGIRRGLTPLNILRDELAMRTPHDLGPIPEEDVPREVRTLVSAINGLLHRLHLDIEAQRRFVANAAHQLRTPVAGLKTQTELALRQTDPADIKHALKQIRTSADRAARLTNQLLTLARTEPDVQDPRTRLPLDLNEVAKAVMGELVPQAVERNIDIGFEGSAEACTIVGDRWALHELCSNLVENAIRYTQDGGQVTVRVYTVVEKEKEKEHIFEVEDNGPGIPELERSRVFERFYRVPDEGSVAKNSGSGLGLAIVREIANAHGADVKIISARGQSGTIVQVRFDRAVKANGAVPGDQRSPESIP